MGRFVTMDPVKSGDNWYVYCTNNPLKFVDYTGLTPTKITGGLRMSLVGGFNIETGFTFTDSNGAYAEVFTIGVGVGVEVGIGSTLLPGGEVTQNENNENICDFAGTSEDLKGGVLFGAAASKNKNKPGYTLEGLIFGLFAGGGVYWNYTVLTIYLPDGSVLVYDGNKITVKKDPNNKYITDTKNTILAEDSTKAYGIIINGNQPSLYSDTHTAEECAKYYAPI